MLINLKKKAENLKKIILFINRKKPVPLSIPDLDENDIFVVSNEIRENNVALGNCIKKFENQISKCWMFANQNGKILIVEHQNITS